MKLGDLVTFFLFVGMFYEPVRSLHQINQLYQAGRAASERVAEILDAATENYGDDKDETKSIRRALGQVEYRRVSFSYRPDVPALHEISLVAKPGQIIALVGPTGAGISTLVSLLSRFYEATSGEILLDGRNVADLSLRELREQIGVVSQETFLFNEEDRLEPVQGPACRERPVDRGQQDSPCRVRLHVREVAPDIERA